MQTGAAMATPAPPQEAPCLVQAQGRRMTAEQQALAAQWSGLPRKFAHEATPRPDLADHLEEVGMLELCKAAMSFDPTRINQMGRPAKFSTYAYTAVRRAVATALARELHREEMLPARLDAAAVEAVEGREPEPGSEHPMAGWGSLQAAVEGLPDDQRLAVEEAFCGSMAGPMPPEQRMALKAALAKLRGDCLPFAVGEEDGPPVEAGTPWQPGEEAWLYREFHGRAIENEAGRARLEDAARRLGRTPKAVRRKLERMAGQGADVGRRRWLVRLGPEGDGEPGPEQMEQPGKPWSAEDEALLHRSLHCRLWTDSEIEDAARRLGRSPEEVCRKLELMLRARAIWRRI